MKRIGVYEKVQDVTYDELRDGDWIVAVDHNTEDAIVSDDEDGKRATWFAGGYADELDLGKDSSYVVMRELPLTDDGRDAADLLDGWFDAFAE